MANLAGYDNDEARALRLAHMVLAWDQADTRWRMDFLEAVEEVARNRGELTPTDYRRRELREKVHELWKKAGLE